MAFVTTVPTSNLARAYSVGPIKAEFIAYTAAAADTTGTITSRYLHEIDAMIVNGVLCTAQVITNGTPASVAITFQAVGTGGATGFIILYGK